MNLEEFNQWFTHHQAAFPGVADQVRADMHLHPHVRYFLREARVTAYAQARLAALCCPVFC